MFTRTRRNLSVALLLLVFCATSGKLFAQNTCAPDDASCVVSGSDPEPIGHVITGGPVSNGDVVSGSDPEPIGHVVDPNDPEMQDAFLYALLVLFGMA